MEVIGSLVDLGVSIVPVPGLKPAFDILQFIWENVQRASYNRKELRGLAMSAVDILTAVNYVLSRDELNEHVRVHLDSLERVFDEIRLFAEEHATANLFKILLKKVDIEGHIEHFQSRLQHLLRAFSIAAYGDIKEQLEKIYQGQHAISQRLPTSSVPIVKSSVTPPRIVTPNKPLNARIHVVEYQPVRIEASFSEPCRIEIRQGAPIVTCLYFGVRGRCASFSDRHISFLTEQGQDYKLSDWGIKTPESKFVKKSGSFDIIRLRDSKTWTWTVTWRMISVSIHDPAYPNWKDMMDIVFPSQSSAADWFSRLEAYASSAPGNTAHSQPQSCNVDVRKKVDCWMQKAPNSIDRRRPVRIHILTSGPVESGTTHWLPTIRRNSRSFKAYATHFTYMGKTLPFVTVYRSGDTLVMERCRRAYDEEPTAARRFRFETEGEAKAWYYAWMDCAKSHRAAESDEPVRVDITFKDPFTIHLRNYIPALDSPFSLGIRLHKWGLLTWKSSATRAGFGFEVTTLTTSWTWTRNGNRVVVRATNASQPDWHDSLEIAFRGVKSAEIWFTYLMNYCTIGLPSSLPPRAENVVLTKTRVSWMKRSETSVLMRTGVSDEWGPVFEEYKKLELHQSHLALVGPSVLPHVRVTRSGTALILERRDSPNDSEVPISQRYQFGSEAEAKSWYEIWKEHLKKVVLRETT